MFRLLLQKIFHIKLKRNVINNKMTLYWWMHWFWITSITAGLATPVPLSSYETISTSLKSALVQSDNSFQQTNDQQKIATGSKSVPLTFETSDIDDTFGGAGEIDAETSAKNNDFLKPVHVKLEKSENIPENIVASISLPNAVNSTKNATSQVATTMLSSVTESAVGEKYGKLKLYQFSSNL
jgi:hypothetical protein